MQRDKQLLATGRGNLASVVTISRQFLRSVRIDQDIAREDALSGYICQGTARSLLESMARQIKDTRQRAFTWTGPYGGGKSSLALMLCSMVGKNVKLRERAMKILDLPKDSAIHAAFAARDDGWLVLPLVGKRAKISDELATALAVATDTVQTKRKGTRRPDIIGELVACAEQQSQGLLIVVDELGKFLEAAAHEGDDVYFFQELAEAASRSAGKLVVVGILHQSFDAYAARLGREARDEWSKVQGRFVDIPLVAGTDEVVELVGRAIDVDAAVDKDGAAPYAKAVAHAVRQRRPGTPAGIGASLSRCWPLHPVVATLLGPISRRRFSQNERSTFGFLASREPLGFMEFMEGQPISWSSMYGPSRYWDYLCANMEAAILASPDGHRWAVASEAVERAEAKGTHLHIELTKSTALIEMFRGGSGLVAEVNVLGTCVQGAEPAQVASALKDLMAWNILIERKHLGAFGVFAGSDFDIEAAVHHARGEIGAPDLQLLATLTDLQPVLAKRLYHETGTMRWFTRRIVRMEDAQRESAAFKPDAGSVGSFLLCLPERGETLRSARKHANTMSAEYGTEALIFGVPANAERISDLGLELVACERVFKTRTELDGDSVARKELIGRIGVVRAALEDELGDAFSLSNWYWKGELQDNSARSSIAWIASKIAGQIFGSAPRLHSELLNRQEPSSNSRKARKELMYRMARHATLADLGYDHYSADAGLYYSLVKPAGLHREREHGAWGFGDPFQNDPHEQLFKLWRQTNTLVLNEGPAKRLSEIYQLWAAPPFGMRNGVMPVLSLAYFLSHRSALALYVDGVFTPDLSEAIIDEWLLDPKRVALRYVSASVDKKAFLDAVSSSIPASDAGPIGVEPLSVARALVGLAVGLPNWTRRTTTISPQAQAVRAMLLKANDPHKVLFADLPTLLESHDAADVLKSLSDITRELTSAYPKVLEDVMATTLRALDQTDRDLGRLRSRAKVVRGIAGEFRLEAFVTRLENFDGTQASIEGLVSLATSKPPAQWVDRDIDGALLQLGTWAHDFRRAETVAPLRGRTSTRRAIGVVFGASMGREIAVSIDIDDKDSAAVSSLASRLVTQLLLECPRELALAALAEAGALLFEANAERITP